MSKELIQAAKNYMNTWHDSKDEEAAGAARMELFDEVAKLTEQPPANDAEDYLRRNEMLHDGFTNFVIEWTDGRKVNLAETMEAYASQKVREERERVIDLENEVTRLQFAVAEAQNKLINHLTKEQ